MKSQFIYKTLQPITILLPFISTVLPLVTFLLLGGNVFSQDQLNEYLKLAASNNPHLKSQFKEYLAAMEKVPQVGTLPNPEVAFAYFVMPVETRLGPQQFRVSLTQMFPWFGTLKTQKSAVTEMAMAKYEVFEGEKDKLFFDIKSTYYKYYVLEKAIAITKSNMGFLNSFRGVALKKYEAGKSSMVDVLRADMEIAELENQLALLQDNREPLTTKFEQLINSNLNGYILIPDSLWQDSLAAGKNVLLDSILTNSPQLQRLDHAASGYEEKVKAARKSGSPSIMLGVDYINVGQRSDMDVPNNGQDALLLPKVGLSLPIYRSKYKGMINEANLMVEATQLQKENAVNQLKTQLEIGYRDYLDGQRRVALNQKLLQISEQALDLLVADYSSASKDFEEVLRMERLILKYALELEKARADQNEAVAYLEMLVSMD